MACWATCAAASRAPTTIASCRQLNPPKMPSRKPKVQKRAAPAPALPRIFVSIASYRDTECQWTVKDLFEKARHPERVFAGICWQFIAAEDADCFEVRTR